MQHDLTCLVGVVGDSQIRVAKPSRNVGNTFQLTPLDIFPANLPL